MSFKLNDAGIKYIVNNGLAHARLRFEFERLYHKNELGSSSSEITSLIRSFASTPDVDCDKLRDYSDRLQKSWWKHLGKEDLTGEQICKKYFEHKPKRPVEMERKPYGVHLFLYVIDLVETMNNTLKEGVDDDIEVGIPLIKLKTYGAASSFAGLNISRGFRAHPTLVGFIEGLTERYKDNPEISAEFSKDDIKASYNLTVLESQNTAKHELEHSHNRVAGIDDALDELTARTTSQGIITELICLAMDTPTDFDLSEVRAEYLDGVNQEYGPRFPHADLMASASWDLLHHPYISLIKSPGTTNLLNAILCQIGDVRVIAGDVDKIVESVIKNI
jgi:hypothetical protein